ncbi:glycosyltransferase family 90 protein [Clohesyomyces aquaticus]|uniref:Glycosyltransferase family 90 protein n=1 Tax=Clohesyomyces aquaticus TaxID=1231657 RepID=A0A1Y2A237_9PLEO|nr:glycosyltransferase family 90 protein [Clohesyomyces aquaticus]
MSKRLDVFTGLAGAATTCATLTQYLFSQHSEPLSEILSWILLPILFQCSRRLNINPITPSENLKRHPPSSTSLWIVAACLTLCSVYRAENGIIELFPLLTQLLLAAQTYLRSEISVSRISRAWFSSPSAWGTTCSALLATCTLALPNGDPHRSALSVVAVGAHFIVYTAFLPRATTSPRFLPLIHDFDEAVIHLSWRVVASLLVAATLQTHAFGFTSFEPIPTLLHGLTKSLSWYFIVQMTRISVSWCIAAAIGTFGLLATRDPFMQSSDGLCFSQVLSSLLALIQVIYMLPKSARARSMLWAFFLLPLVPYLANVLAIRSAQSSARSSFGDARKHPVEELVNNARVKFEELLQRQSQSYTAAYEEYRRRYGVEPPNGFDAWYEFATSQQSPIIDDFDTIYHSVSPFWSLSGSQVLETMNNIQAATDNELWLCEFSSNENKTHCSHPHRTFDRNFALLFNQLLEPLPIKPPGIKLLVNHLDEPRVLLPPQLQGELNESQNGRFVMTDLSHQPIWDSLTKFCGVHPRNSTAVAGSTVETFALPFVTDAVSAMDMCQHQEHQGLHGLLMSPSSFHLIESLVPILSTGAPSTMGDILFPSPAYIEDEFQYKPTHDIEWDKKRNDIYWAGSTTGGYALDGKWLSFHRQRLVTLGQNLERKRYTYLRETGGVVNEVKSLFLNARLYDVAFTRINQCDTKYCRAEKSYFRIKGRTDSDRALHSRLAFDMDGNGISGRYYKLLASNSVPLKQTLFREWHDDRLVPWVHYIPVSQSLEELPELVSYLTSNGKGQRIAKEIADQGREWFSKGLREVDMSVYTYRLLLELARVQDPGREILV